MKKLFNFLLVACLGACFQLAPTHVEYTRVETPTVVARIIPVFISGDFGAEDKLHIDDALNMWNYALNGSIILKRESTEFNMGIADIKYVMSHHGLLIIKIDSTAPYIPKANNKKQINIAWADLSSRATIYVVRDRIKTQDIFPVLLHEVGHILGASHVADEVDSLMNPTYTFAMYQCIDKGTVEQVAQFNNLSTKNLNYCVLKS